ncbi:uncharacterized protein LOC134253914 [Saccostrea cucullata]|uniref:uncharacterized protein LOC134253914 n=1 Tax=Saccostrea cuccullata TaxID=36930 RepID=UPI002ED27096
MQKLFLVLQVFFFLATEIMELQSILVYIIWIPFVLHSASKTHAEIPDASKGCTESKETAVSVETCPKTEQEWKEAASRKGCNKISHSCSSFEYHCVINAWKNETVEVCAPIKNIVGNVCTEYSFGGSRIQRNSEAGCKNCPSFYYSNKSYKYPEYNINSTSFFFTSTLKTTAISDNKESITPSKQEMVSTNPDSAPSRQKGLSTDPDSESDLNIKILIPICIGLACLIAFMLVCAVYHSRKECFLIRDIIARICTFRKRQKQTSFNENINTHIENTPLREETPDHCSVNMEPS